MPDYYVNKNKQSNGDNEVHVPSCTFFSYILNKEYLGNHRTCHTAVTEAKRRGYSANGCYFCSEPCHTQ